MEFTGIAQFKDKNSPCLEVMDFEQKGLFIDFDCQLEEGKIYKINLEEINP